LIILVIYYKKLSGDDQMTRNSKFLSFALALATLSLVALETEKAEGANPSSDSTPVAPTPMGAGAAPAAPALPKTVQLVSIDNRSGFTPRETLEFKINLSETGEIQSLYYRSPNESKRPPSAYCRADSKRNCLIRADQLSRGVVLEKMYGHDVISLKADAGFSTQDGGKLTLSAAYEIDFMSPENDVSKGFEVEVRPNSTQWVATHAGSVVETLVMRAHMTEDGNPVGIQVVTEAEAKAQEAAGL
jgi:hypothetical protein